MTLNQACADLGIDPDQVRSELEASPKESPEWSTMSIGDLVDHILETHHGYLHEEIPRLRALMAKVVGVHGENHPELKELASKLEELLTGFEPHLMKEESMLFPAIKSISDANEIPQFPFGAISNPINMMLMEHDRDGEILKVMREIANNYEPPMDACMSYQALYRALDELEKDTHLHIHKENNVLFPAVLEREEQLQNA